MAVAGSLTYETKLDTSGFQKGMNDIESKTKSGGASVKNIVAGLGITKLVTKAIDTIKNSMDGAISRLDTMNNFPKVMSNLGISAKDSQQAINKLSEGLQGIPTTLDAGALAVQRFTSKNGDVKKSVELFLAVNDAILAGGANSQIQESALEQLSQAYSKGKMDMMEWRTIQMAMPAQLKQVATAMGLTTEELGEMLRTGDNTEQVFDDFLNTIMRMDKEGVKGFKSLKEQARNATGGIQTSITNMKTAIVRGVATMIDEFDKLLKNKGLGGLGALITKVGKTAEKVLKDSVKWIAPIVDMTLKLINVLAKFSPIIIGVVTAITTYKVAIGLATVATNLFTTALSLNPIGLIVAGVVALSATATAFYHSATKDIRALDDEVKKSKESVDEFVNSYKEAQKARNDSVNQSLSELDYYKNLWNELKNITDENGKVNEGYKERAQFIATTLNEALGTEIKITDGIIENYGELNTAIEEHIKKLKAEAIITAQKDLYTEAIKKRKKGVDELRKAEEERNKQQAILNQLEEKYGDSLARISGPVNQEITKQINAQKKRVEETQKSYDEMQNTVNGYYDTIKESEAMFTDYEQGNYDKLNAIHYDYQTNVETDEKKQKESLLKQITNSETDLQTLKDLKAKYNTDVYDDDIKATEDQLKALKDRYAGIIGTTENSEQVVQNAILESLNKQLGIIDGKKYEFRDAGNGNVQLYVDGFQKGEPIAQEKASKLSKNIAKKLKDGKIDAKEAGEYLVEGVTQGVSNKNKQSSAFSAVSLFAGGLLNTLKKTLKIASPSKVTRQYGEWLLEGFNLGINDEKQEVLDNVDDFSNDIVNRMSDAVNVQTGKMAFSGTSGTVNQILTATGTTTVVNENKLLLDGDVVYENQKKVTARKNLQTQFGGAYNVSN